MKEVKAQAGERNDAQRVIEHMLSFFVGIDVGFK